MKRKIVVAAALAVAVLGSAESCDTATSGDGKTYAERQTENNKDVKAGGDKSEKKGPSYTSGQENAIAKAQDYLSYGAFSKKGLADQLAFEGFKRKDADFAVNHIKVNWKQQAVAKGKDYLDQSAFSEQGLIDQLKFEGFTPEQATFGARQALK